MQFPLQGAESLHALRHHQKRSRKNEPPSP